MHAYIYAYSCRALLLESLRFSSLNLTFRDLSLVVVESCASTVQLLPTRLGVPMLTLHRCWHRPSLFARREAHSAIAAHRTWRAIRRHAARSPVCAARSIGPVAHAQSCDRTHSCRHCSQCSLCSQCHPCGRTALSSQSTQTCKSTPSNQ